MSNDYNTNGEVRNLLWGSATQMVADFSNPSPDSYDGYYTGEVMDNNDPDKFGRCKIKVFGLFDKVDTKDMPWATPDFGFVGSKKGSFIVPPVGCVVRVYFENNDVYFPIYTRKVIDTKNIPKNAGNDYPNTMVFFETDMGSSFEINRVTDKAVFTHYTGTSITIDPLGNVVVDPIGTYTHKGSTVIPDVMGPYNCIPVCPFSKQPHAGQISNPPLV